MKKFGILGPKGTHSEEAALWLKNFLREDFRLEVCADIFDVLTAVAEKNLDAGLVPVENSLEGSINVTLDILARSDTLTVVRELVWPVKNFLLTKPNVNVESVRKIFSHAQPLAQCRNLLRKNFPDAEIFSVIGDLVDNGEAEYQWRAFFNSAAKLFDGRIFAPVMGNHECYGVNWLNALPTGYLNQFALPDNNSKNFGGYFYSFDYGAAHFFILNTQFTELDKLKPKLQSAQEYFLRRDVAQVNRPWKIVFMHKDIYDYAQDKFNDIADKFLELFDELEIDLVFTGHLHTYRNRGKIFARKKSSHGTTYILCGRSGDQKYVEPNSAIDDVTYKNLRGEPESFIALNISAKEINLTAQTVNGEILDEFTLRKE